MCALWEEERLSKLLLVEFLPALSDLEKSKQARAMVTVYGLNDKIGNVTYYDSTGQSNIILLNPILKKLQNH
jgi:ATP-dependent Zn protease